MVTLSHMTLDFNRQMKLSHDGGDLPSDTGEFLFRELDEKLGFFSTLNKHLELKDDRQYYVHSNEQLLRQEVYQMIAGYAEDDAADQLTNDPVLKQIDEVDALASQPSLSRLFPRFDDQSIEQLNQANLELLDRVHQYRDAKSIVLDLDSTHADTYGDQEDANFNTHYGTVGFHPLVTFDGVNRDFLKAKLQLYF